MSGIEKIRSIYRKIREGFRYYNEYFDERLKLFPFPVNQF